MINKNGKKLNIWDGRRIKCLTMDSWSGREASACHNIFLKPKIKIY